MTKHLFAASLLLAASLPAHAATIFGIDQSNNIVNIDSSAPGNTRSVVPIQGVSGHSILAMDTRVSTGITYILSSDFRLLTLDLITGTTSLVANLALTGSNFAFDFNPTNTNLRIVSNNNTNYVYNFATNALVPGVNVAYSPGTPVSNGPSIIAAGYTNNDNDAGTGTTLFVIDSANSTLATQNPTTGVLTLVGALGVNVSPTASFDILTTGTRNETFLVNNSTLYSLNLSTGALSSLGNTDRNFVAITASSNVPEPATYATVLSGMALLALVGRKKKQ